LCVDVFDRSSRSADHKEIIMRTFIIGTAVAAVLTLGGGVAAAAGGNGQSYCSNAGKPDGYVVDGDVATYNNPGEIISRLGGPGIPGLGRAVQTFCNPNLVP
jgi:hypothetical protein